MAAKKTSTTPPPYEPQGKPTSIRATSRVSVKIKDNFYTFEFMEERTIPADAANVNMEKEREALWDTCHGEVDKQVDEIVSIQKNGR